MIKHKFVSAKADSGDTSIVRPSNWNDDHQLSGSTAVGGGTDQVFYENGTTVNTSYTITTGNNAMSAGPITVASGATVTVPSGSTWSIGAANSSAIPAFMARQTTAQTAFAAETKLVFQTEDYDTANAFDNVTNNRFQPQVAGWYWVYASMGISTTSGNATVRIRKNGDSATPVNNVTVSNVGPNMGTCGGGAMFYLNGSTDYLEAYGQFTVSQQPWIGATSNWTYFQGVLVRPA